MSPVQEEPDDGFNADYGIPKDEEDLAPLPATTNKDAGIENKNPDSTVRTPDAQPDTEDPETLRRPPPGGPDGATRLVPPKVGKEDLASSLQRDIVDAKNSATPEDKRVVLEVMSKALGRLQDPKAFADTASRFQLHQQVVRRVQHLQLL